MATKPFRITPSLGPGIRDSELQQYWDGVTDTAGTGKPSYQPGSKVTGSDGHEYVYVKAAANIAADTAVTINETTWVATAGAGTYKTLLAVLANEWFHARAAAI